MEWYRNFMENNKLDPNVHPALASIALGTIFLVSITPFALRYASSFIK